MDPDPPKIQNLSKVHRDCATSLYRIVQYAKALIRIYIMYAYKRLSVPDYPAVIIYMHAYKRLSVPDFLVAK